MSVSFVIRPGARGRQSLVFVLPVAGGDTLRVPAATLQVGPAPLRLNEVLPAPAARQGEWVELVWDGPGTLDLGGHVLADADGAGGVLPPVDLAAGALVVVAADSVALAGWWRENTAAGLVDCPGAGGARRVVTASAWPSLNNTPPADRTFADRVMLLDPQGVVLDAVTWGGVGRLDPGSGLSLERLGAEPVNPGASAWAVATAVTGSTPGCVNSVAVGPGPAAGEALSVRPPLLDRAAGASAVHLEFDLAGREQSREVRVFNLWGDVVRDFGGDAGGAGPRDLIWDGRDDAGRRVPAGAYVVWLETRAEAGDPVRRERCVVVVR